MDVAGTLSEKCYLAGMRYGKVDFEVAGDWATRSAADDGPIYMVNFMKYRAVADYDGVKGASGDEARVTGREADDRESALVGSTVMKARETYRADPEAAQKFLRVGQRKLPPGTDPAELAAWTLAASMLLNLDEAITHE